MIMIGLEDCSTCKIAKNFLVGVNYVELKKEKNIGPASTEIMTIKKSLGRLNSSGHFPVILNDDFTKIITTEILLDNLNVSKLQRLLES